MSYIVEFEMLSPILQEAVQAVPDIVIETEDQQMTPDGSIQHVIWAQDVDFQRFETAVEDDPTIEEIVLLTEVGSRRLYRVTLSEVGKQALTYPVSTKFDMVFLEVTTTEEGSTFRARVPSREALFAYREACRERDIPFRLKSIYHEEQTVEDSCGARYGVTDAQQEALLGTLERGYFAIPRKTTLKEVAEDLDISTQAISTRLRRGQTNLIRNTLATEAR